jgi:transcription initiation factor TFIIB
MSDLWPGLHTQTLPNLEPVIEHDIDEQTCQLCREDSCITTIGAEVICTRCGTILDIPLEWGAEYRWFSSDTGGGADPSRCGFPMNPLMPESSLGTMILAGDGSRMMRRIKRYHMWNLMPYRERTLWTIFESLQVRATNAGIGTSIIEEAKELYAQLTATSSCRGQNQRDAMLAACLWEALKRHDSPRMPKDIAEIFTIPLKNVTKGIKLFQSLLAMRSKQQETGTYANPTLKMEAKVEGNKGQEESDATLIARSKSRRAVWQQTIARTTTYDDFINPFLTNLSAPIAHASALASLVRHICARTEELGIVPENTPPSLTASVIAFCCQELHIAIDHTDIARICGISPVTIQKCLKRLQPWKEKLLEQ